MDTNVIHTGDAFDVLPDLPDESIHACVTDPPYGLAFMGRDWDDFEPKEYQEWCERWAREVKRVLKPGAHLLAFSGNRTHHRLFSGVEDAGFEIRDTVTWHYGSGFPKALDVSKAIDKATDAAEKWDGFKTALKPATEYVVVARKPFAGTVAENVQTHGAGALNIDGCRVETDGTRETADAGFIRRGRTDEEVFNGTDTSGEKGDSYQTTEGRYPSNVVFDETEAERLDREVGNLGESKGVRGQTAPNGKYGEYGSDENGKSVGKGDSGGPSRYFYTSKASKAERTLDGQIDNAHPTVKPADLMEWLVRLVTAEDQIVLDPFTGSGTTCRAAKDLGRHFVGIERQAKWADVARVRCGLTPDDPAVVRGDDDQRGLEAFDP